MVTVSDVRVEILDDPDPDATVGWLDPEDQARYRAGEFSLVGVRAVCTVTVMSQGTYGIRDDSPDSRLADVAQAERDRLADTLRPFGLAV